MLDKHSKNTIKAILAVLVSVFVGEGVLGIGIFWPFLFILLDWRTVYWFVLVLGVIISGLYRIPVGLPSLFLVTVIGGLSFILSSRKENGWMILLISLVCNYVFDLVFGLGWTAWEILATLIAWFVSSKWFESETIKINY